MNYLIRDLRVPGSVIYVLTAICAVTRQESLSTPPSSDVGVVG